ncbi:N-formylglutamate amidohydrolase [Thalassobaculum sp.]|uniref:N-formylglutamate amidohydrolase n=1 Tax=Thalassobaculum sp. TaxID=2022740 RepID=UPI0032EE1859
MARLEVPSVLRRTDPKGPPSPLVFDSPHTGLLFPADFRPAIPLEHCERVADWFVEELFGAAPDHGAILIEALFRRAYIDPNRSERDLDLSMIESGWPDPVDLTEKTARGASLVWKVIDGQTPIYDRTLSIAEVRNRIETYWRPYHSALKSALDETHARFGKVFHVDCHSMPEFGDPRWGDQGERRADFIVGTRDGTTASPAFTEVVVETLRASGYSVSLNDKFKGVELIRRYAHPAAGREALQIEVNRGVYMDETTLTRSERFGATQAAVTRMIAALESFARDAAG